MQGRWTWRQRRQGRWISSRLDYFLAPLKDRRRFKRVVLRKPRHHDTDHRAIVATLWGGKRRRLDRYRRKVGRCPLQLPPDAVLTEDEKIFEELKATIEKPSPRTRPQNQWVSNRTWALCDHRAMLRRYGSLNQNGERRLGRKISQSFAQDRKDRAAKAAGEIEAALGLGDIKESFNIAKRWYRAAEDRAPKPCYESMAKQTAEREELYRKVIPPGDPIPINVDPYEVQDEVPGDMEIRAKVKDLRNGRAGGASKMRAEDIRGWLRGIEEEEDQKRGTEGAGNKWRLFVKLIQSIWRTGSIPRQMMWVIVVLIPKGGGDYRGIGLLEPLWKVIEKIMDSRLNVIEFHDCLHGFVKKRGCGTAGLEAKLAQQLAYRCYLLRTISSYFLRCV